MKVVCKIFGHRKLIRDWNPWDPICSIACDRCNKILVVKVNPNYVFTNDIYIKVVYKCNIIYKKDVRYKNLTEGKIYDILYDRDGMYCIKNDIGELFYYSSINFKKLSIKEYRQLKLKKLNMDYGSL